GIQLSAIRREQGRAGELEEATRAAAERFEGPVWKVALADVYAVTGQLDRARDIFERLAATAFDDVPDDPGWHTAITILADICVRLDDARYAPRLYDLLAPHEGRCAVFGPGVVFGGTTGRRLGELATLA